MEKQEAATVTTGFAHPPDLEKTTSKRSHTDVALPDLLASNSDTELLGNFPTLLLSDRQLIKFQPNLDTSKNSVVTSASSKSSVSLSA